MKKKNKKNTEEELIINNLSAFLDYLGIKKDKNTIDTPKRMLKAWREMCRGVDKMEEIKDILSVTFPAEYTGMISQGPINIYSLCSHHLLPVFYDVFIGYIPRNEVIGFGKISKALSLIAAKPQNQEDFTQEVADIFKEYLKPEGLGVLVMGKHTCMFCRSNGVNHQNALNVTSAVRGLFRKNGSTREEFLNNVNLIKK